MVERIERIEQKLDDLATSISGRFDAVDQRFNAVDRRFDAVDRRFNAVDQRFVAVDTEFTSVAAALAEQRQYTEFAFSSLDAKMDARFDKMDARFDRLEQTLGQFIKAFSKPERGPRRR